MPEPGQFRKDKYGLPVIDAGGTSSGDSPTDRPQVRAPLITGGKISGKFFQTDDVNPRIVIDSNALTAYDSAGNKPVTIDVVNARIDLLFGSGIASTLRWVDTAGTLKAQSRYSSDVLAAGMLAFESNAILLGAESSIGTFSTTTLNAYLWLINSNAGAAQHQLESVAGTNLYSLISGSASTTVQTGTMECRFSSTLFANASITTQTGSSQFSLTAQGATSFSGVVTLAGTGAQGSITATATGGSGITATLSLIAPGTSLLTIVNVNTAELGVLATTGGTSYFRIPDTTARFRFGTGAAGGTNAIDVLGSAAGGILLRNGGQYYRGVAGQVIVFGFKGVSAAASNQWGYVVQYLTRRSDTAGVDVTPASITLGTAITNTNSSSPQFTNLRAESAFFKVQATAAGSHEYLNTGTVN